MDKLTLKEVEICCKYGGEAGKLARHLRDAMRENEQLRKALQHYKAADDGVYQMIAGFRATKDMEDPNSIAGIALRSNKDSDHE